MRQKDFERQLHAVGEQASDRVRRYADGAASNAQNLLARGQRITKQLSGRGNRYGSRMSNAAEDFVDEANYHYRRLRRQVNRHPVATVAIVAGTIGAFLLLRRMFSSDDED